MQLRGTECSPVLPEQSVSLNSAQSVFVLRVPARINVSSLDSPAIVEALRSETTATTESGLLLTPLAPEDAGEMDSLSLHLPHKKSQTWKSLDREKHAVNYYTLSYGLSLDDSIQMHDSATAIRDAEFCPPVQMNFSNPIKTRKAAVEPSKKRKSSVESSKKRKKNKKG